MRSVKWLLIVIFLQCVYSFSQQIKLSGQVIVHNSKYNTGQFEFIANATISASFCKPAVTDAEGKFLLEFVGLRQGTALKIKCEKNGYEVVNSYEIERVTLGRHTPLKIFVVEDGGLEEAQLQLYEISKNALFEKKEKLIKSLRASEESSRKTIQQLKEKYGIAIKSREEAEKLLTLRIQQLESQLPEFAMILAQQNLDFASEMYLKAYHFFLKGEIEKVIEVLDEEKLENITTQALQLIEESKDLKEKSIALKEAAKQQIQENCKNYELKAESYLLMFDYQKGIECYEKICALVESDTLLLAFYLDKTAQLYFNFSSKLWESSLSYDFKEVERMENKGVEYQDKSIALYEEMLPENDLRFVTPYYNKANQLIQSAYDYDLAYMYLDHALIILLDHELFSSDLVNCAFKVGLVAEELSLEETRKRKKKKLKELSDQYYKMAIAIQQTIAPVSVEMATIYKDYSEANWLTTAESDSLLLLSHSIYEKTVPPTSAIRAESYVSLATIEAVASNFDKKMEYLLKADSIYNELKENSIFDYYYEDRTQNYLVIANNYESKADLKNALRFQHKYVNAFDEAQITWEDQYSRYDQLIYFHERNKMLDSAAYYYTLYIEEQERTASLNGWYSMYKESLADIYHEQQLFAKEIELLDELITESDKEETVIDAFYFKRKKANALAALKKPKEAKKTIEEVLSFHLQKPVEERDVFELIDVYEVAAKVYTVSQENQKAIFYWKAYYKATRKYEDRKTLKRKVKNKISLLK